TGAQREDRLDGTVAAREEEEATSGDGRGDGAFGLLGEPPQLLARLRIVAAGVLRAVGHELRALRRLPDDRRRPRRDVVPRRGPETLGVFEAVGGDEGVLAQVALEEDQAVVQDRRAAESPLDLGEDEEARIERPEVAFPELFPLEVVAVEPLGAEARD